MDDRSSAVRLRRWVSPPGVGLSMTDDDSIELSRRKVLAGLGTVGVTTAGVGLGTSAYFSDRETFTNNSLTAGSLDMKLGWAEHYSDWSEDEAEFARMPGEGEDPDLVFPGGDGNHDIELVIEDQQGFLNATAIEAYPDPDDDAIQDDFDTEGIGPICNAGADTPEDLDPTVEGALRTENDDTVTEEGPLPLISIEDVKPGDFGEVTFDVALCDNPGYLWMTGTLRNCSENGHTEPERKDPDESSLLPLLMAGAIPSASSLYDSDLGEKVSETLDGIDPDLVGEWVCYVYED